MIVVVLTLHNFFPWFYCRMRMSFILLFVLLLVISLIQSLYLHDLNRNKILLILRVRNAIDCLCANVLH